MVAKVTGLTLEYLCVLCSRGKGKGYMPSRDHVPASKKCCGFLDLNFYALTAHFYELLGTVVRMT